MRGDMQGVHQRARQTLTSVVTEPISFGAGSSGRGPSQRVSRHHPTVLIGEVALGTPAEHPWVLH